MPDTAHHEPCPHAQRRSPRERVAEVDRDELAVSAHARPGGGLARGMHSMAVGGLLDVADDVPSGADPVPVLEILDDLEARVEATELLDELAAERERAEPERRGAVEALPACACRPPRRDEAPLIRPPRMPRRLRLPRAPVRRRTWRRSARAEPARRGRLHRGMRSRRRLPPRDRGCGPRQCLPWPGRSPGRAGRTPLRSPPCDPSSRRRSPRPAREGGSGRAGSRSPRPASAPR